jgi:hypothetical protein
MKSYTKYDIALFIHEHGKTRWKNLLKAFVENGSDRHISHRRLSDYLNELCAEGLVTKTVDKQALLFKMYWKVYPIYVVPKDRQQRIEEIRTRKPIYEFVDFADPDNLARARRLHETIRELRETS